MAKALKLSSAINENLKVVRDSDGTSTPIELSKDKLKINGDLEATGYTDNIKLREGAIINADGNITLDSAGDIILDAHTGKFVAKNAGTEFSAAGSAFAGMILGYTSLGLNETPSLYPLTTSYVVPTDEFSVAFVVPPSGKVEISIQIGFLHGTNGVGEVYAGLSDANATSGYNAVQDYHEKIIQYRGWRNGRNLITHSWTETGLTAGDELEYWVGFKSASTSGSPSLSFGGDSTGEAVEFIMKATALPATITT